MTSEALITRSDAAELLEEFGEQLELVSKASETYNPETQSYSQTTASTNLHCYHYSPEIRDSGIAFEGNTVAGDRILLIEAIDSMPDLKGAQVELLNETWTIVLYKTHAENGIPVLYECLIRK